MHRFFVNFSFDSPVFDASSDSGLVRQMRDILKMKKGESVRLFNTEGQEATCIIDVISKRELCLSVGQIVEKPAPARRFHLFCAVLKKDNFELVVQKATEVGVTDIYPMLTDRTIKQGLRLDRLERIAIEATEQSGRIHVPMVHEIIAFEDAMPMAEDLGGACLALDMSAVRLQAVMPEKNEVISIFVGPEGGWSERERSLFEKRDGWKIISLGDGVYRAETAAIIASYLVANS